MADNYEGLIELVRSEYDEANKSSARYFDFMYRVISSFVLAVLGIILVPLTEQGGIISKFLLQIGVPAVVYVFGLFYCYNSYAIGKIAYFQKICEEKIKILSMLAYHSNAYLGWVYFVANKKDNFKLPYGTFLALFILFPAGCILLSFSDLPSDSNNITFAWPTSESEKCILAISLLSYIIFFVFMVILIFDIKKMVNKREKVFVTHHFDSDGRIHFVERETIPPKKSKGFMDHFLTMRKFDSLGLKKRGLLTTFEHKKD